MHARNLFLKTFSAPLVFVLALYFFMENAQAAVVGFNLGGARITKEVKSLKAIKTQNIVTQSLDYSCGPAVIATILSYYFNDKISEKEIISYLLLTTNLEKVKQRKGFSLLDLKQFAKVKGYNAVGYKMDLAFLSKVNKPILVPIKIRDYNHFVVFRGLRRDRVFLADPVLGHLTMPADKFAKIWKGRVGLILTKKGAEEIHHAPLNLSKEEETFLSDSSYVQRILGENALGRIFADGEF